MGLPVVVENATRINILCTQTLPPILAATTDSSPTLAFGREEEEPLQVERVNHLISISHCGQVAIPWPSLCKCSSHLHSTRVVPTTSFKKKKLIEI